MSGHEVQMRWRDLDALGHVNHPVVLTYLEEGRDAFLADRGISRDEYVVGRCTVSYRGRDRPGDLGSVMVECEVAELGHVEREDARAHRRRGRRGAGRGRVRDRPLGPGATRVPPDHRRGAHRSRERRRSELELGPRGRHLRHHRRRRLSREQPEHPVHDRGDRQLGDRGGGGRRDDRPPPRPRGRRHAVGQARALRRRDRPHPRREPDPHDGLDRRLERHDDRGAHHRPRGQARHLRRRVGLDELRRRDLHHAAARRVAGSPSARRTRASRWRSRSSTSATWSAP